MNIYAITSMVEDNNVIDPTAHTGLNTVQVASLLIGVFIPILVGVVTKRTTNPSVQSLLLLALSAITGFLTEFVNSANFVWQQALLTTVVTFVIGVATHYGLWNPTGVTARALAVGDNRHTVHARTDRGAGTADTVFKVIVVLFLVWVLVMFLTWVF